MFEAKEIQRLIGASIQCEFVWVGGDDGVHFSAKVVSAAFRGVPLLRRHQMIYGALGTLMGSEIHAIAIEAFTPPEWELDRRGIKRGLDLIVPEDPYQKIIRDYLEALKKN